MCQKESWGAIFATTEAHSTQRDQPPRMHGPGLWMYEQKEQRVTPVPMIGVNCNLWCPGWDAKISEVGARPRIHLQTMAPIRNDGEIGDSALLVSNAGSPSTAATAGISDTVRV